MKRFFVAASLAVLCSVGFSSCRKCQICTKANSDEHRICEKDYDSNTAYGLAIDAKELDGYECK